MMIPLELKGAMAGGLTSVLILAATFTAGGFYRAQVKGEGGKAPPAAESSTARDEAFFFKAGPLPRSGRGWGRGRSQPSEATN
jgi:hypothetical protein